MASALPRGSRALGMWGYAAQRAERVERLLDRLELGVAPLRLDLEVVLDHLEADKKHEAGALRWVLPTADGHTIDKEVPLALVRDVTSTVLAGRGAGCRCRPRRPMSRILVLQGRTWQPLLGRASPTCTGVRPSTRSTRTSAAAPWTWGSTIVFFQSNHEGESIRPAPRARLRWSARQRRRAHPHLRLAPRRPARRRPAVRRGPPTDPSKREPFRSVNYLADIALTSVVGKGAAGYSEALDFLARHLDGTAGA